MEDSDNQGEGELAPRDIAVRQAALPVAARELHRAVLRAFLDTGTPPDKAGLSGAADALGLDVDDGFEALAEADLVHLGPDGAVVVAYPFSGNETGIRVRLPGRPVVHAMCAVDALGIPPMSGGDAVITAADPHSGQPIRVEVRDGKWSWRPDDAVVLMGNNGVHGPSAARVCPVITFHADEGSASGHLAALPGVRGRVLGQDEARELGEKLFGDLLAG